MPTRKIRVQYVGLIRNVVGQPQEEVSFSDGGTVRELLHSLAERHGDGFRDTVLGSDERLCFTAKLLLDGRDINELDGLDTKLGESTETIAVVTVFPMAGG